MNAVSVVRTIFEELRKEVAERYRPGDLLPNERLLGERFGVSRNTIREVVIFLEAYGLVEKTKKGPRVCAPDVEAMFRILDQCFDRSLKTCREVLMFRRLIEVGVLPEVIEQITDEEIDRLERLTEELERAMTAREAAEIDFRFHSIIVGASRNGMLQRMYEAMSQPIIFYLEIGKSNKKITNPTTGNHKKIVDALRERSYRKAFDASNAHFNFSESIFIQESGSSSPDSATMEGQGS